MFEFISFLEGLIIGGLFIGIFLIAIYFQLKDIAKAIRDPKDVVSKNLIGQTKKAQIVKKLDNIDELLG